MYSLHASITSMSNLLQYLTSLTEQIFFPLMSKQNFPYCHSEGATSCPTAVHFQEKLGSTFSRSYFFPPETGEQKLDHLYPLSPSQSVILSHVLAGVAPHWTQWSYLLQLRTTQRATTASFKLLAKHDSCQDSSVHSFQEQKASC